MHEASKGPPYNSTAHFSVYGGVEAGDPHSLLQFSHSMILSVNDVAMCVKCFELRSNELYKFKDHYVHNHSC